MRLGSSLGAKTPCFYPYYTPPLDYAGSGCAFAYGLRKLLTSYAGYAIRVRRDADDFEVEVKFDSANAVSLASPIVDGGTELTGSVTGGTYSGTMTLGDFAGTDTVHVVKWYDQSGNGRDAYQFTENNQPVLMTGAEIDADGIDFAGTDGPSDDRLIVDYKFTTNDDHTLHVVAKTDDAGTYGIFGDLDGYNDGVELLTLAAGNWSYRIDNTDLEPAATTTNKAHILASYETGLSGSEQQLRVNGVLAQQDCTETIYFNTSDRVRIGCRLTGDNDLNGKIAEVMAWNSKVTTAHQTRLVDETIAYHGLPKPSYSGVSLLFDNVDDYVYTGTTGGATGGADYNGGVATNKSYSFWAKTTNTSSYNSVFDHGSATRGAFHFTVSSGRNLLYLRSGGTSSYRYWVDNGLTYDGDWHHHVVFLNIDVTNAKYYIDGVLQTPSTTVATGAPVGYTHGVRQGRALNYYYDGSLDEFAVFDGELSAANVLAIYNGGTPADLSPFSPEHWWRNGDGDSNLILTDYGSVVTDAGNTASLQGGTQYQFDSP